MLIVDLHLRLEGHYLGFIQSIVAYIEQYQPKKTVNLLLPYAAQTLGLEPSQRVAYVFAPETERINPDMPIRQKAAAEWEIIQYYAQEYRTDEVLLMEWDLYQLEIGKVNSPFKVSGIWFRPFSRIELLETGLGAAIKTKLWRMQKALLCRWSLRNRNIHRIFLLNDKKTVDTLNRRFRKVFKYLPDPILSHAPKPDFDIRESLKIEKNRVIFLIFGVIEARKNVVNILKAIQQLNAAEAEQITLLTVGKVWENYEQILTKTIAETQEKRPQVQIVSENRFVENDELENFFQQSDVVMVNYQNFFGSSGVVGNAAKYNKPLIASDYGLIGEQVEQNHLGECVNPNDVSAISNLLRYYLDANNRKSKEGIVFANRHKKERFVETLLGI